MIAPPIRDRAIVVSGWSDPRAGGRQHKAIDIPAPKGTPVYAAETGVVVRVQRGNIAPAGIYVTLRHDVYPIGGMLSRYLHLNALAPAVEMGTTIKKGQLVGTVGDTGTKYDHLHHDWWVCNGQTMANWIKLFGRARGLDVEAANRGECTRVPAESITPVNSFDARVTRLAREWGVPLYGEIVLPSQPLLSKLGGPLAFTIGASIAGAIYLGVRGR